ncbi:MAG: PilC/PilY family type IV pilus protein, partial [Noviherbaspirillum sp.]
GLLGATVAGAPLLVAPPAAASDDPQYAAFVAAIGRRPAAVYLQANDGMVHAFDADSGAELFAYLPHALQPYWPRLYTSAHAAGPYVDGALAAGDALVGGAWKTVLAGALGSAAQGVFVLDISDPARFAQGGGALFEVTDRDDPDIGNVFGAPAVARFRTGAGQYGDFVVTASGYNNNRADGAQRSNPGGPGVLFLLSLDKDPAAAWQLNHNYFKFALPAASGALANGLAQPALIAGDDGSVRDAYAGHLQGQLWRVDFGSTLPPWAGATGMPLFAASDAGGKRQPITTRLRAIHAQRGMLLLFGTGRLLEAADAEDKSFQSFYAVSDQLGHAGTASRADLARRQRVADGAGGYRLDGSAVSANGWLIDFPVGGERIIGSAVTLDGKLYFATMLPGAAACAPIGGLYLLDAQTGQPPAASAPWLGMAMAPGRTLAVASDTAPGQTGAAAQAGSAAQNAVLGGGAGKPVPSIVQKTRAGRLGWREVVDWEALRNAMPQK